MTLAAGSATLVMYHTSVYGDVAVLGSMPLYAQAMVRCSWLGKFSSAFHRLPSIASASFVSE
eukprot:6366045-Prymnesium_polylepis.1